MVPPKLCGHVATVPLTSTFTAVLRRIPIIPQRCSPRSFLACNKCVLILQNYQGSLVKV